MKTARWIPISRAGLLILLLALAGCGTSPTPMPTPAATDVPPTATPVPTSVPTPTPDPVAELTEKAMDLFWESDLAAAEEALLEALGVEPEAAGAYKALALVYTFQAGREAAALEAAEKAVEIAADDAGVHAMLAQALWNLDRDEEALEAAQKAAELDANSAGAQVALAQGHLSLYQHDEALAAAEQAVSLDANSPFAYHALSIVHRAMGMKNEALAEAQTAAALKPSFSPWQDELAEIYWRLLDDEVQARAYVAEALTLDPDSTVAQALLAEIEADAGNYDTATDLCDQIKERIPEAADGFLCQGDVHLAQEKYDEAAAEYEQALEAAPDDIDASFALAWALLEQEEFDEAIAAYEALVEALPYSASAHQGLSLAELWSGDPEEALLEIERTIELDPYDPSSRVVLGQVHMALEDTEQAEASFKQALKMDPEDAWLEFAVAGFYFAEGRNRQAVTHLERAAAMDPRAYAYELGRELHAEGDYGRALEYLQRAQDAGDDRDVIYGMRGLASADIGDYDQAERDYEAGLEIYPDSVLLHLFRGDLHMRQGHCEDAIVELEYVLEADPGNELAQQAWEDCDAILHPAPTPVPGATAPPSGAITQDEGLQLAREAIAETGATPGEMAFDDSEGSWTWLVTYASPRPPDSEEFEAEQKQIVLEVCEILFRIEPKVESLGVVAVDEENETFKGVFVLGFVLKRWQDGELSEEEFIELWFPMEG